MGSTKVERVLLVCAILYRRLLQISECSSPASLSCSKLAKGDSMTPQQFATRGVAHGASWKCAPRWQAILISTGACKLTASNQIGVLFPVGGFSPSEEILVSWGHHPQHTEKQKICQTMSNHQPVDCPRANKHDHGKSPCWVGKSIMNGHVQ